MRNTIVNQRWLIILLFFGLFYATQNTQAAYITSGGSQWLNNSSSIFYNLGNVGIGTTDPLMKLDVEGDAKLGNLTSGNMMIFSAGEVSVNSTVIPVTLGDGQGSGNGTLLSVDDANSKFTLMGGNVGIGTTTPASRLVVSGGNAFINDAAITSGTPKAAVTKEYLDSSLSAFGAANNTWLLSGSNLYASSTTWNVGIGTAVPDGKLHVLTSSAGTVTAHTSADDLTIENIGDGGISILGGVSSTGGIFFGDTVNLRGALRYGHSSDYMEFWTAGAQRVGINNEGNVGIGTTTPATKLQIEGSSGYHQLLQRRAGSSQALWSGAVWDSVGSFIGSNAYYSSSFNYIPNYTAASGFEFRESGNIEFFADAGLTPGVSYNPTERMIINTSGNVGIGNMGPSSRLDVSGGNVFINDAAITSGTPKAAVTKEYLDSSLSAFGAANNAWLLNGSNLYASSTTWNVGIGTTTAAAKLEIQAVADPRIRFRQTGHGNHWETGISGGGSFVIRDSANGFDAITIAAGGGYTQRNMAGNILISNPNSSANLNLVTVGGGNVGIGTTTPAAKLESVSTTEQLRLSYNSSNYAKFTVDSAGSLFIHPTNGRTYWNTPSINNNFYVYNNSDGDSYTGIQGNAITLRKTGTQTVNIANSGNSYFNAGNIGIATTTPTARLSISGGNAFINDAAITSGTPKAAITKEYLDSSLTAFASTNNNWILNGSNLYASSTSWNVGIGTTSPGQKLEIVGSGGGSADGILRLSMSTGGGIRLTDTRSTNQTDFLLSVTDYVGGATAGTFAITDKKNNATRLLINSSGNVGVGTTNPDAKLNIVSPTLTTAPLLKLRSLQTGNDGYYINLGPIFTLSTLQMGDGQLSANAFWNGGTDAWQRITDYAGASNISIGYGSLAFQIDQNTLGTPNFLTAMYINSSSNIGLGTTNPDQLLTLDAAGASVPSGNMRFRKTTNVAGMGSYIQFDSSASATARGNYNSRIEGLRSPVGDGSGMLTFYTTSVSQSTAAQERLRITDTGNVGIGTTTPGTRLTIVGTGNHSIDAGNYRVGNVAAPVTALDAVNKSYMDSAIATATSTITNLWGGTTGGNIWSLNSGNVGIGVTNPGGKLTLPNNEWIAAVDSSGTGIANMFRINSANQIEVGSPLSIGQIELAQDGGMLTFVDMPVTAAAANGSAQAYSLRIDGNNLLNLYSTSNGAGGVNNLGVGINTSTPDAALSVNGSFHVIGALSSVVMDRLAGTGNRVIMADASGSLFATSTTASLPTGTSGQTMRHDGSTWLANSVLYNNGTNLGIGTTSPNNKLDVVGVINATTGFRVNNSSGAAGNYLRSNGTNFVVSTIQAADVPTLNQNTTGYAGTLIYEDNRTISPSELAANRMKFGFTSYSNNNSSPYADFLHLRSYQDASGGSDNLLVFNKASLGMRLYQQAYGSATAYSTYKDVLLSDNSPTVNYMTKYTNNGTAVSVGKSLIYDNGTNVGISTTTLAAKLSVSGGNIFINDSSITSGTPKAAVTKEYLDSAIAAIVIPPATASYWTLSGSNLFASSTTWNIGIGTTTPGAKLHVVGNAIISTGLTMGGSINLGGNNITNINKLTVGTIDPLYNIKGINYSTFASAIVGGVKEEYVGRIKISRSLGDEYEARVDFSKLKEGSDLWVWRQVVDFNTENIEALITPYGSFANVYYRIDGESLIFRSDRPAEISYRLIGKRHDWRQWPTRADDQEEEASFKID